MRKADYCALAAIIKRQRRGAYLAAANARSREQIEQASFNDGKASALELLADCFAREARVNRPEFLKACGIGP